MEHNILKAVILDFDGTIGDSRNLIVGTMRQTLAELALPQRTDSQCAAMIGLPLKESFITLLGTDDATGELCAATYRRIFALNNRPGAVKTFPNVIETIRHMHAAGLLVTIASSRSHSSLDAFVNDMGLSEYIPYVLGAGDVDRAKPAPDMVLKTLADNGLRAEEALVVGDTAFDISMGQAAGVTYGNGRKEDMLEAGATFIIDNFGALNPVPVTAPEAGTGNAACHLIITDSAGRCMLNTNNSQAGNGPTRR